MEDIEIFLIIGVYTLIINYALGQFVFLKDKKYTSNHKIFTYNFKSPPFSGGILFLVTIFVYFSQNNLLFIIFFFSYFFYRFFI